MFEQALLYGVIVALGVALWWQYAIAKRAERLQRRADKMFRSLFQQQFQFMAMLSPEGRVLEISDTLGTDAASTAANVIFKDQVIGQLFWQTFWFDRSLPSRAAWPDRLSTAAQTDGPIYFQDQFSGGDGETRIAQVALTAVRTEQHVVEFYVLQASDVTVVKQAESDLRDTHAELKEKARLLTTMLSSISQGIFMVGEDGRVSTFNPRVCELLELPSSYLQSRPSLQEITQYQIDRGDFGAKAEWVDHNARSYVTSGGQGSIPGTYLRQRRDERVIEVKTQTLPTGGGLVRTFTDVTDYVQAEEARKRLTTLLQASQGIAGVGGWEVDMLTNKVSWTDEVYRILDTSPAEYQPSMLTTMHFYAPEWVPVIQAAIQDAEHMGEPHDLEVEMITAKGRRIWVHSKSTLTFEHGRVTKRTSVIQDITVKRQSEAALRANEELLRQITAQVPGMVYRLLITPDGSRKYSFVSAGVRVLYGVEPEAVIADGSVLQAFRHPDDRLVMECQVAESHANNTDLSSEFRVVLRDGTLKWVQLTSSSVSSDALGTVRNGVMIDITARKKAVTALHEQDALWKLALESTGDGVWDWHIPSGDEVLSPRCLEMYGYKAGDLRPFVQELDDLTHSDDVARMNQDRQAHFDGLTPTYTNERRIRCRDGSWKWIMSRGLVISRSAQGQPVRMIGTHTDITRRKQAEVLIWQQANFDALTGLPNRRMLRDRIDQDIKKCRREGSKLAVLFLDLDHFKEVNDTLGHHQGDALLVEAGKRIRTCVRDSDTVARMGGDEFVVLMMHGENGLSFVASRLQTELDILNRSPQRPCQLSMSIGVVDATSTTGRSLDALLAEADQAMYASKRARWQLPGEPPPNKTLHLTGAAFLDSGGI